MTPKLSFPGAPARMVMCPCCWGAKEKGQGTSCAGCTAAGCAPKYAGYWQRGKECPRARKFRKAGRNSSRKKVAE